VRILIGHPGPSFSVADVYAGWREALTDLGVTVSAYNFDDRLTLYDAAYLDTGIFAAGGIRQFRKALDPDQAILLAANGLLSACFQFWPDVVLLVSGFLLPSGMLDLIRSRRIRVVVLHTELPYELDRELELARHADLSLVNDPIHLDQFRQLGPAAYVPHAYRPTVHHPGPPDPRLVCDFAFVGTAFQSRIDFLEAMDLDGLDVLLGGNWQRLADDAPLRKYLAHDVQECLDNTQTADVYRSAKVGLNLYRREGERDGLDVGWAMGPREVEMAACGLFFLRDPRPEGDELLPTLPTFTDPDQASRQLRWWLEHDRARETAAAKAREAIADRTFTANARQLLGLLDK
jgi:spore maturation protein CgeB